MGKDNIKLINDTVNALGLISNVLHAGITARLYVKKPPNSIPPLICQDLQCSVGPLVRANITLRGEVYISVWIR